MVARPECGCYRCLLCVENWDFWKPHLGGKPHSRDNRPTAVEVMCCHHHWIHLRLHIALKSQRMVPSQSPSDPDPV